MAVKPVLEAVLPLGPTRIAVIELKNQRTKKVNYKFLEVDSIGKESRPLGDEELLDIYAYTKYHKMRTGCNTEEEVKQFVQQDSSELFTKDELRRLMSASTRMKKLFKYLELHFKGSKLLKTQAQKLIFERAAKVLATESASEENTRRFTVALNLTAVGYYGGEWLLGGTTQKVSFESEFGANVLECLQRDYQEAKKTLGEELINNDEARHNLLDSQENEKLVYSIRNWEGLKSGFRFDVTSDRLLEVDLEKIKSFECVSFSSVITLNTLGEMHRMTIIVSVFDDVAHITINEYNKLFEFVEICGSCELDLRTGGITETLREEEVESVSRSESLLSYERVVAFVCGVYESFYTRATKTMEVKEDETPKTNEFTKPVKDKAPEDIRLYVCNSQARVSNVTIKEFVTKNPEASKGLIEHKSHKSPITHIRRGHWSHSKLGKVFWVGETIVNEDKSSAPEEYINYVIKE